MGFKIGSTAIIWGFSTGMLAICIPLISMTESGVILPLSVIIGATISTVVVWLSSSQSSSKVLDKESNKL
jgi:hypothetical protein